ncbi:MAG: dephospho-CoA kinase [Candidatus Sericytochromatia bacterium]|nr:dephospho-CoA kinase [Candidatus Sericytochromatia bacterium]
MPQRAPKTALPFLHVGLTGGIACGKSLVSDQLEGLGCVLIDSDLLAREIVRPGQQAYKDVVRVFGPEVVTKDGTLDRKALGRRVFADPEARRKLEAILHPRIRERAEECLRAVAARPRGATPAVVVEVIPLLYEVGLEGRFDEVWVVACQPDLQRARLRTRDGLSPAEVEARLAAQASLEDKVSRADRVIRNDGSREELAHVVREALAAALEARGSGPW